MLRQTTLAESSQEGTSQQGDAEAELVLDEKMRLEVIEGAIAALMEKYVFPETAQRMGESLRERLQRKEYDSLTSPRAFAQMLTSHLQQVSRDKHLRVRYSAQALPRFGDAQPDAAELKRFQEFARFVNHGFEKVERLGGNIGYLDLRSFMQADLAAETAAAAMTFLCNTDALVVDLRQNGGGHPEMIALLSSYLFDKPTHLNDLYSRPDDNTEEFWTHETVAGTRYGSQKYVYVLTSRSTFSGAEEFAYNLQNLKRATIVGETTGGGAHPTQFHRINDHFGIGVPFARAINPITKTNWEGTGVTPDVVVDASLALKTAHLAAAERLLARSEPLPRKRELEQLIETLRHELDLAKAALTITKERPAEAEAGPELPSTAAGRTLRQFLAAFNTGDLATLERFHREHGGAPDNARQDMGLFRQTGGLNVHKVVRSSDFEIEVLVQAKKDERWLGFSVTVDPQEPYGISNIRARPAAKPE
jgi:hypothetical protein